ncbi:hypothetical protein [Oryza sativa Japonica Group]|uniref:Uncharacterized protein n=1 Tax=Oryza sativa subsp. japonica TaxID=39947 RepID=Q5ZE93_ORYSJ|nr:hypothetical protein [Oryza sativa Japonica Group]BAD52516.1 hypothetical protein [Oryza sativa Japonica Group]
MEEVNYLHRCLTKSEKQATTGDLAGRCCMTIRHQEIKIYNLNPAGHRRIHPIVVERPKPTKASSRVGPSRKHSGPHNFATRHNLANALGSVAIPVCDGEIPATSWHWSREAPSTAATRAKAELLNFLVDSAAAAREAECNVLD